MTDEAGLPRRNQEYLSVGPLEYEPVERVLRYKGVPIQTLSVPEVALVCNLMKRSPEVVSYESLYRTLSGGTSKCARNPTGAVYAAMKRIRKAIPDPSLFNVGRGRGYRLLNPRARAIPATRPPVPALLDTLEPPRMTVPASFGWRTAGSDARDHFVRSAMGQRSRVRGGDLFRGRDAAMSKVRDWLTMREHPGRVLVITGEPGAGKSALIARVVLMLESQGEGPGLAFHAHGATLVDFTKAVAGLVEASDRVSPDVLLGLLAAEPSSLSTRLTRQQARPIAATLRRCCENSRSCGNFEWRWQHAH